MDALLIANARPLLLWLAAVNLGNLVMMAVDKANAIQRKRRVPEKYFFLLALLGGGLGGTLGMWLFRHKTRHWYFKYGLPAIFILEMALIVWLLGGPEKVFHIVSTFVENFAASAKQVG